MTHADETRAVVEEGTTDILTDDEVVHVPPAAVELAEATLHRGDETFVADMLDWDQP